MKIFLVILYLGKSVGILGPLPGDLKDCRVKADNREWFAPQIEATGHMLGDVTLDCVRSRTEPKLGEQR